MEEEGNYVVTTDMGNEFQGLEQVLPEAAVHRQKRPEDRNATAVIDRAIQTLKKDLAGRAARDRGGWGDHVEQVTSAYNKRPHEAVHAAPEDVEKQPATTFRVYQDNAQKFKHNDALTRSRQRRLQEAGAFRAPTNAARSFQPQYGAAKDLGSLRLHGGAGHRWQRDPAEACLTRAAWKHRAQGLPARLCFWLSGNCGTSPLPRHEVPFHA